MLHTQSGYRIDVTYIQREDYYPVDSYLEELVNREICESTSQSLIPSNNIKYIISFWYDDEEYIMATIAMGKLMELRSRETVIEHVAINKYVKYTTWRKVADLGTMVG